MSKALRIAVMALVLGGSVVAAGAAQRPMRAPQAAQPPEGAGSGVTVEEVVPRSAAASAGIRAGDVIVAINGSPVSSYADMDPPVVASGGRPLVIDLIRHGRHLRVQATPRAVAASPRYGVPDHDRVLGITHWEERWILMPCALDPDCE